MSVYYMSKNILLEKKWIFHCINIDKILRYFIMKLDKKNIKKILININPKINSFINKKNINLTDNGLLDSLMIIKFISEIENLTKKKIKISKISRNSFANIESILEFLKK